MSDYLAVFERGEEGEPTLLGEAVSRDGLGDLGEVKVGERTCSAPSADIGTGIGIRS